MHSDRILQPLAAYMAIAASVASAQSANLTSLTAFSVTANMTTLTTSTSMTTTPPTATPVTSLYTPYYPALATGYTVNVASVGTATTSAVQPCQTQPEEGTFCGFLNPLDPCGPQPDGYGPVPTPDTPSAFLEYPPFHSMASAAPSTIIPSVPSPSSQGAVSPYIRTFLDLDAITSPSSAKDMHNLTYLGIKTLTTYNAPACAAACDERTTCTSFNLYISRDPSLAPSANDSTYPTVWGYWCPNPASMTSYKCMLYGSEGQGVLNGSSANNPGHWQQEFQTVVTGSSGWSKIPAAAGVAQVAASQSVAASIASVQPSASGGAGAPTGTVSAGLGTFTGGAVSLSWRSSSGIGAVVGAAVGAAAVMW